MAARFGWRGRALLVASSARRHGTPRIRPGSTDRAVRRAYPSRLALGNGVFRAGPRSRLVIGTRRGTVSFVAVAARRLLRKPKTLRRYLRDIAPADSASQ
jgi:hypothetical protein